MTENESQQKENPVHHGYFLMIPAHIANDPEIDDSTTLLFGRIAALANHEGYCWASNKYLAELSNCKERELQYRLEVLEKKGYLRRELRRDGFRWERKLIPNFNYETHMCAPSKTHVRAPSTRTCVHHKYISKEIDKKNILRGTKSDAPPKRGASAPSSSQPAKKPPDKKKADPAVSDVKNFLLTRLKKLNPKFTVKSPLKWNTDINKLLKHYTVEDIKGVISWIFDTESDASDFWKKTIQAPASLYRNIDQLIIQRDRDNLKALEEHNRVEAVHRAKENKKWAEKLLKQAGVNQAPFKGNYMKAEEKFLAIREGKSSSPLDYDQENFQKIVEHYIKKWKQNE